MKRLAILAALAVIGCRTTVADIQGDPANMTFHSSRGAQALEGCLAARLSWAGTPSVFRSETSTHIGFGVEGDTGVLVSLHPVTTGGTRIEVRRRLISRSRIASSITSCA